MKTTKLLDYETRLPAVVQKGRYWCIPACIENLLRYAGLKEASQEDIVFAYCIENGDNALVDPRDPTKIITLAGLQPDQIRDLALKLALRNASFDELGKIANNLYVLQTHGIEFEVAKPVKSAEYVNEVKDCLLAGQPCLISYFPRKQADAHICVALEIVNGALRVFDPADGQYKEVDPAADGFSYDILILKRTAH